MFTIVIRFTNNACITRGIAAIFNMISEFVCVNASSNTGMCFTISYVRTYSPVKGV